MKDNQKTRILIVEDDDVSRVVTERFLTGKGYCVDTAVNGQKALALLGNENYDVVLMDVLMPKIDGLRLAKQMKKSARTQNIPIIGISAGIAPEDMAAHNLKEMDMFLTKPFEPETLLKAISAVTSGRGTDILDFNGLLRRMDGDLDFIKEVAELFCHNARNLIAEIEKSADFDDIREKAHRLKGAAATAGALSIAARAEGIEKASKEQDMQQIRAICQSLPKHMVQYIEYLAAEGVVLKMQ